MEDSYQKLRIYVSAFISGASMMILEVMGTRMIEPFLGNSIFTWIGVLSVMMVSLSLGYFLGGRIADRKPHGTYVGLILILSGISVALIPLFSHPALKFASKFGMVYGPIPASFLLLSIPSIFLAMVSPYLVKLNTKRLNFLGESSGNIYTVSTLGSILGTLLAGFVIIPNFGIHATLFSLSLILLVNGALFLGKVGLILVVLGLVVNFAIPQPANFEPIFDEVTLYETTSASQYMRVADLPNRGVRLLLVGHGAHNEMPLNSIDPLLGYPAYQKLVYTLLPNIKKALFIGLGGGVMPSDMRRKTNADITVAETDPSIVPIAKEFFNFFEDEKLKVEIADGRLFLSNSNETYDYIVVDAYLGPLTSFHTSTVEFLDELKKHLSPGGLVFVNIISSIEGEKAGLFKSIYKTYKSKFKNIYVFSVLYPTNFTKSENVVLFATDSNYGDKETFVSLFNASSDGEAELATHYYNGPVDTSSYPLLTDDFAPVEFISIGGYNYS